MRTNLFVRVAGDVLNLLMTIPEFAYSLLRSLRTSSIAAIVDRLNPLLHMDPVIYLPPEITFEVFSYLDPQSLLRASTLSRTWRSRSLDPRLWRRLFGSEGWSANVRQVKEFEQTQSARFGDGKGKARARTSEEISDAESKSPKRRVRGRIPFGADVQDAVMESSYENAADSPRLWDEQHGIVEADDDEKMEDVQPNKTDAGRPIKIEDMSPTKMEDIYPLEDSRSTHSKFKQADSTPDTLNPPTKTSLLLSQNGGELSMNWQYLYKQKRRLEENWQAGRFKNFQLPHPSHAHEAHAECVYTVQYTGKHLVSGSRDKTLRIWDLDTQRLMVQPLRGHDASVLCLQFDDRPEQDIVISGGSDCHVILWQFSTGKMLRRIERAHAESVLNLRFDDRFLVTCSKDKTIKVWNRTQLHPTDPTYPSIGSSTSARFPSYILNMDKILENQHNLKPLREYSLIMTLHGHTAAVNAIQILDNQIVSASGDRHVKVWDVRTGYCMKTIPGHQKGIACVQFDGRRIVSGSSDETVRIFDRITGAEVACLRGHANLVRTVQARFGDIPGAAADEENEARSIDNRYYQAKLAGTIPKEMTKEQRRARNAGSSDPKDIFALGAKLPPGGGGSRWARIVSGSYDETVIIWKRNTDGKWTPAQQLYQWEAVLNAGGQPRYPNHRHHPTHWPPVQQAGVAGPAQAHQIHAAGIQHTAQAAQLAAAMAQNTQAQHIANQQQNGPANSGNVNSTAGNLSTATASSSSTQNASVQASASTSAAVQTQSSSSSSNAIQSTASGQGQTTSTQHPQWPGIIPHHPNQIPPPQTQGSSASQRPQQQIQQQPQQQSQPHTATSTSAQINASHTQLLAQQTTQTNAVQPQPHQQPVHHVQQVMNPPAGPALGTPAAAAQAAQIHAVAANPGAHPHTHGPHAAATHANSRVFKLQFDSRRIICCSQDPTIVGWDFANGEKEIEEASRFFGEDW